MRPQLRLRIRRIRIGKPRTRQNRTTLNPRMQSLLPQRQTLQARQTVFLRRTTIPISNVPNRYRAEDFLLDRRIS